MSHAELNELAASVRALRAENSRLETRLDKLEQQGARTLARRSATAPATVTAEPPAPAPASDAVPPLQVVKLRPRVQAAPPVTTRVEVVEPPEGVVDELHGGNDTSGPDELRLAEATWSSAVDALKTGAGEAGSRALLQFVTDWPRHPRADNALSLVGDAQMAQQDFAGAAAQFERVLASYPAGDAVLESLLKLGECRQRLRQPLLARAAFEQVVTNYPGTPAASQAAARLASMPAHPSKPLP